MTHSPGAEATPCVIAVDGGGSKTACAMATPEGAALGQATGGPANYQTVGAGATRTALSEVIAAAARDAGRPLSVRGLCFALAGVDRPDDLATMREIASALLDEAIPGLRWQLPADRIVIVNDAVAALVGGTGRTVGVVAVAGTGSIAFGQNRAGEQRRAGGWGHLLGDEGSGYAIGLAGLRTVCRAADGRAAKTRMTGLILDHFDLSEPSGLIGLAYKQWGVADVAAVAPLVGVAATAGDAAAQAILHGAAEALALATTTVIRGLGLIATPFEVVTAGGLWLGVPQLRPRFTRLLQLVAPQASIVPPRADPVSGAVLLARRAAGAVDLDDTLDDQL